MKKRLLVIITTIVIILLMNIVSSAAYLGDVNNDGKITASDARTILRVSAKLDKLDNDRLAVADLNSDGKITASDARTALRMSAKLEQLIEITTKEPETQEITTESATETTTKEPVTEAPTTEEPTTDEPTTEEPTTEAPTTEEPTTEESTTEEPATEELTTKEPTTEEPTTEEPTTEEPTTEEPTTEEPTTEEPTTEEPTTEEPTTEAPVIYPDDIKAFLAGKYYISGKTPEGKALKIAVSGDNAELAVMSGEAQLSLMKKSGKTYLKAISAEGKKYYVKYTELMKEVFGADFKALTARFDFASYSDKGTPVVRKGMLNEYECDVYSFKDAESTLDFFVIDGNVYKIEKNSSSGNIICSFIVAEMSNTIPSEMLKTTGFTSTTISNIPYVVPEFAGISWSSEPTVKTYPKAINVFLDGKYHLSGTLYDGKKHAYSYTYDGTDVSVSYDGISYFYRKNIKYIRDDNAKIYALVTDAQLKENGIDFSKMISANSFALYGKTECIAFERTQVDGVSADNYTLRDEKGNVLKFTIVFERLAKIAVLDAKGNEIKYIVADEFDDDIPDGILTLIGYRKSDLATVMNKK